MTYLTGKAKAATTSISAETLNARCGRMPGKNMMLCYGLT
jgi:hypothetical protein